MDFVETKFFYKNHVLKLNLKIWNIFKKKALKTEKMQIKLYTHEKYSTLEKYLKLFSKNLHKNRSILKYFWLEKYLKVVFSMENVCKVVKIKTEKIMKFKNGSNKKIVFSQPLEKYVLGNKKYV